MTYQTQPQDGIKKEIIIQHITQQGRKNFGFARVRETGDMVFIPWWVILENELVHGEACIAELVPNVDGHDIKLMVNMILKETGPFAHLLERYRFNPDAPVEPDQPQLPIVVEPQGMTFEQIKEACFDALRARDTFLTTSVIIDMIASVHDEVIPSKKMARILDQMYRQGSIARLELRTSPKNTRVSKAAWAEPHRANLIFEGLFS